MLSVSDLDAFAGPATLIFARRVKPGRELAYKSWVAGFRESSRRAKGFLGAGTMGRGATGNEYISVVRFDTFDNLRVWEESELRHEWLAKLPPDTVEGEAEVRRLEGMEFWFTAPGVSASTGPSPHKMALVLFAVVFVLVSGLTPLARTFLATAPQEVRILLMVAVQVGLMTYVIMPRVTRLLGRWLLR
jgi:antibiotic biosynthesis monooxygenase (ABM) superfamily enzyme